MPQPMEHSAHVNGVLVTVRRSTRCPEGDKRQGAPVIIEWRCPKCGSINKRDYGSGQYYFMYPVFNAPFKHTVCCKDCDHGVALTVKLSLSLSLEEGNA